MTFQTSAWWADGNPLLGQTSRLMLQAAMAEQQGVVDALDLIVQATGPNTAGVNINQGACVIQGQDTGATQQGFYTAYNTGVDGSLVIAPTGGTIRSDMVVIRAEDPTFSGTPWGGSPQNQFVFPRVIQNVGAGVTQLFGNGQSLICLARIDIPISTSIISQAMIIDVRQVARPMRQRSMLFLSGSTWNGSPSATPTASGAVAWPSSANFSVAVPWWATSMIISHRIDGVFNTGSGTANGTWYAGLGGTVLAPTVLSAQPWYATTSAMTGRTSIGGIAQVAIPTAMRNTTQTLTMIAAPSAFAGSISTDQGSNLSIDIEFLQIASLT